MKINFKKLNQQATIPSRSKEGDAGYDMTATDIEIKDNILTVHTGIAVEIPSGYAGFLFPRSSICKTNLSLTNSVGVIDSNYRGDVCAIIENYTLDDFNVSFGDRICQMKIERVEPIVFEQVEELSETNRNDKGFGSSGV